MTADYERWQQLDFVVGIRIELSNNHTLNGKKFHDICDELSAPLGSTNTEGKGCYPKDFKFLGWHPLCRCHVITILKTDEEIAEDTRRILAGEPLDGRSVNRVDDVPQEFTDWVRDNSERIERAKSLPYFIKDNKDVVDKILNPKQKELTTLEKAKLRHEARTPEQIEAIKRNYWMRFESDELTQEQKIANINAYLELERQLKIKRGRPMTYNQADHGRENPYYAEGSNFKEGYLNNCQTCTMAHLLRRKGFNVSAMPNKITQIIKNGKVVGERQSTYEYLDKVGVNWMQRFINPDGKAVEYTRISSWAREKGLSRISAKQIECFLEETMRNDGIYEIYCGWKTGDAHVFCAEVVNGKMKLFDPQSGKSNVFFYISRMKANSVMCAKIDQAHINELIGARLFAR